MVKSLRTLLALFLLFLSPLSLADTVNINTADAQTLAKVLRGVGPAKAEAIIGYRTEKGGFNAAEDIIQVPGIGPKIFEMNKDRITVQDTAPPTAPAPN